MISGVQYDQIHDALSGFTAATGVIVEVAYHGDHLSLNAHLSAVGTAGVPYDLVSTHSKYAPSQRSWLRPLDDLLTANEQAEFDDGALGLCRLHGSLLCVPRNIDARLLFVNRDHVDDSWTPSSWIDLLEVARRIRHDKRCAGFAFPTRNSGLFGTFYELTRAFGGHLFDADGRPDFVSPAAVEALRWMINASDDAQVAPHHMARDGWYFDEVSSGYRVREVAMIGDWPGYYAALRRVPGGCDHVRVMRYPTGIDGRRYVYAGCHAWAIPVSARNIELSMALLRHLVSPASAMLDAGAGMIPVRRDVHVPIKDDLDTQRARLIELTVAHDLLTFPPMTNYPILEDKAASSLRAALVGQIDPVLALRDAQRDCSG